MRPHHLLRFSSSELSFSNVRPHVLFSRSLSITNPLEAPMEVSIRGGSPERYTVEPSTLAIEPQGTSTVEVRLKLPGPLPNRRQGGSSKYSKTGSFKDTFMVKSSFGVQRFFASFTLSDSELEPQSRDAATAASSYSDATTTHAAALAANAAATTAANLFAAHGAGAPPEPERSTTTHAAALAANAAAVRAANIFAAHGVGVPLEPERSTTTQDPFFMHAAALAASSAAARNANLYPAHGAGAPAEPGRSTTTHAATTT